MKIDFTKRLLTIRDIPLKASGEKEAPDMTLQDAALAGLFAPLPPEKASAQAASDAFRLALRISNSPEACEVSAAEITVIKEGVGRAYSYQPLVCGPVDIMLEGEAIVS